jgi:cytochrome bd-type quinol oxidase subunit 1
MGEIDLKVTMKQTFLGIALSLLIPYFVFLLAEYINSKPSEGFEDFQYHDSSFVVVHFTWQAYLIGVMVSFLLYMLAIRMIRRR